MVHVYCTDSVVVDCKIHTALYNEVRLYRVVHFGIQLPGLSRIQAEVTRIESTLMGMLIKIPRSFDIERLQCHPGKSGGHVLWCLQFCYRMFPICNRLFTTCNRTRDTKRHGRRSSRDDTATSL